MTGVQQDWQTHHKRSHAASCMLGSMPSICKVFQSYIGLRESESERNTRGKGDRLEPRKGLRKGNLGTPGRAELRAVRVTSVSVKVDWVTDPGLTWARQELSIAG